MSMAPQDVPGTDSKPSRRRFRLGLRLWVVMLLIVPLAGALAWEAHRARRPRKAVEGIPRVTGLVPYDYQHVGEKLVLDNRPREPSWLIRRLGVDLFHDVTDVTLAHDDLSDGDLVCLRGLPRLQALRIFRWTSAPGGITDTGLANLSAL